MSHFRECVLSSKDVVLLFSFIGKKEQMKIQPQVHPRRKLQQDQKGMRDKYTTLPVGNTVATWVAFLMVSFTEEFCTMNYLPMGKRIEENSHKITSRFRIGLS